MNHRQSKRRANILIIFQYELPIARRNQNSYQRIYYGADYADVTILMRKGHHVSEELVKRVSVRHAPVRNKWLFLVYAIIACAQFRLAGYRIIITRPTGFSAVGFLAKYLFGYFWVLDIWDLPRWREGQHEGNIPLRRSDRLVFWLMRFANLYIISGLPEIAKDVNPSTERCIYFSNAIDLSVSAKDSPQWPDSDPTIHLAYGKSRLHETQGFEVILKAAVELQRRQVPAVIHMVGEAPDDLENAIQEAGVPEYFKLHGWIEPRVEFFKNIHVGLCPYLDFVDLRFALPIKILEHLTQGNPVIVSRLPGLCSMIEEGHNGIVFEPGNSKELADAVERLQADRSYWRQLSQNALISAKRYDAVLKNKEIFETLLTRARISQ